MEALRGKELIDDYNTLEITLHSYATKDPHTSSMRILCLSLLFKSVVFA